MKLKALIILGIFLANTAFAEESDVLKFNGFGTLGLVHSDNDSADFITTVAQDRGAGYTRSWSPLVDSRLGLQLSYVPNEKFSAVLQVIAEQRHDGVIKPDVEWAYLQYALTPDFTLRLGRTVLPIYLNSEYRKVGYANHWVRPPVELYVIPVNTGDGVDFTYNRHFGDLNYTLRGALTQMDQDQGRGLSTEARNTLVIANNFQYGPALFRFAFAQADLTSKEVNALFDPFRLLGPAGAAIADKYDFDDKRLHTLTVGWSYEPESWFVTGEWSKSRMESFLGDSSAWYVSGGYRWGRVTPYLTYSQTRSVGNDRNAAVDTGAIAPPLVGLASALNGFLGAITRPVDQKTISVGTRWDFAENAAFKIQYNHINLGDNSSGTLSNVQPDFKLGDSVNLLSMTVDFVF